MKKVILTYISEFEDESISDEEAINCSIEHVSQDGNWPSDDDIQIILTKDEPEN